MSRHETEHSPMSGFDEYPIHQTPEPLRVVDTTDARAYERYWFTAEDEAGDFFVVMGFGTYPNLDTADAYAIVVHDGKHTVVRAHRVLGDDRADLRFGPLRAEIVEPFREWRWVLEDNDEGVRFDLRWRDTKRAVFQHLRAGPSFDKKGRPSPPTAGYESFGRVEGTIDVNGRQLAVDPARVRGSRDHHWGIRNGVGGPGHMEPQPDISHCGQWVEFGDWSIWGWRCLYNLGDDEHPGATEVMPSDYRLRFDPETKELLGGVITNTFSNGEVKEVQYEQLGSNVAYLRCGLYPGLRGSGSPDSDLYHGMYVGDDVVFTQTYDLGDPKVRVELGGFDDHMCVARCDGETTVGILECRNPALYEMCRDGYPGFSFLD